MRAKLIVNADDYGRSPNISHGIRDAHRRGIVSSTTCMMNFDNVVADLALALQETPDLGLGVHLVLTAGRPLLPASQLPSLTTSDGAFHTLAQLTARLAEVDPAEAQAEWRAQIERFIQVTGRKPTHLDSHHHSSYFSEGLFRAMLELAQEYGCAIRQVMAQGDQVAMAGMPPAVQAIAGVYAPRLLAEFAPRCPDAFYATFYGDLATQAELLRILRSLPAAGIYELMCHPGYSDPELEASSAYARQRQQELAALTDTAVQEALASQTITLTTFAAV
ncbi:MAG: ChbG/HpnK family deacetylase [Chloroflexi bacterium]|nr:ChbG/HpnK family deacetylase [Chloroflexota bacterium]